MNLFLTRTSSGSERTTGELNVNGVIYATMERPWIENPNGPGGMNRVSCVPKGTYTVIPHHSVNFPDTYALVNHELGVYYQPGDIPKGQKYGRSAILIHVGNRVKDVVGCIAIGKRYGDIEGEPAVLNSGLAMRELDKALNQQRHKLVIS